MRSTYASNCACLTLLRIYNNILIVCIKRDVTHYTHVLNINTFTLNVICLENFNILEFTV